MFSLRLLEKNHASVMVFEQNAFVNSLLDRYACFWNLRLYCELTLVHRMFDVLESSNKSL